MAESRQLLLCNYCEFRCYSHLGLLKHIRATHENDPNFRVYCSLCGKSYNKWCSFKKHLHRDHGTECAPETSNSISVDYDHDPNSDQQEVATDDYLAMPDESDSFEDEKWKCAKFLLHITEEHHLTHDGVNNLSNSVQWLVDTLFSQVKERISAHISDTVDIDKETILKICEPGDIFSGLNTRYLREKFYRERFNFVEPTPILLGSNWEWVIEHEEQKVTEVKNYGYTIELQEGLQALLSNPSVRQEVLCSHHSTDGVLRDFCDANFFKAHPVFKAHPNALQFILFYDDIEVANPLGAKAGIHKLGVFYYILGNIRPVFRSNLQNIQLIAIAKSADIKQHGCDKLLQPFIDQVNALGKANGLSIQLQDQLLTLHGAVICMCGDIPASNYIGGFKEGVAFALRKCRRCLATADDMRTNFHEAEFILRNLTEHKDYISLIKESEVHSVTYGINKASILQHLDNFDVTECLPFDIMHTVFEGVAVFHLNLLLHYLMDTRKWLSLTELNHAIQAHHYGYTECDTKPNKINRGPTIDADLKFKSSASQMMTLIRLLPFMIGNYIERNDSHWECFLQLWDICSIICAFEVTAGDAAHLAWLVEAYLEEFFTLYDVPMTPKLHYLVHLPQQILRFGPLRHHWCMRFESKNAQMKRFLSPQSYQNVPLTVSIHHQMWMCYQLLTQPGQSTSNFLYSGDDIISGSQLMIDTHVEEICTLCGEESTSSSLLVLRPSVHKKDFTAICIIEEYHCNYIISPYRANSIKIHGIHYKSGAVVRVTIKSDQSETLPFKYAKIKDFYIYKDNKIVTAQKLNVIAGNTHIRGIHVELLEDMLLFHSDSLYCHGVLHLKHQGLDMYLIEKDNRVNPTFFY